MISGTVEFPSMRDDMIYYLERLQDEDFQRKAWVEKNFENGQTPFDDIIHFFFDDTKLSQDPSDCIGAFLLNEEEADAIRAVTSNIDLMVEHHGWKDTDAEHLGLPEWPAIVEAARRAHALISPGTPPLE